MTRRLSVWIPFLPIARVRRHASAPDAPAAVWTQAGAARRVSLVNPAAGRLGLAPGAAVASARAMIPGLILVEADPQAETAALKALLAWSRRFTPLAALDPPDGLLLDVTGVAHLFGGEAALLGAIEGRLAAQGFEARAGLADSAELAWALARYGTRRHDHAIAAAGLDERALMRLAGPLPLAALRLPPDHIVGLRQAGLVRIVDILHRPRAPLAARWGAGLFARLDALLGRQSSSISPVFDPPAYVVERVFAEPIARREDVEAVLLALAQELSAMLERHGEGLRRVEASFFRVDGVVKSLDAGSSRPVRDPRLVARLFRERIESLGENGLDTGYGFDLARLSALAVERLDARQTDLGAAQAGAPDRDAIDDLIDRLGARLGARRVQRLVANASHRPEDAVIATPCAALRRASGDWPDSPRSEAPTRPLRLLERPERIETLATTPDGPPLKFRWRRVLHDIVAAEGPERIAPLWWNDSGGLTRDYFRVEDAQGRRFWLYREGLYGRETAQPHWFLHGLFG